MMYSKQLFNLSSFVIVVFSFLLYNPTFPKLECQTFIFFPFSLSLINPTFLKPDCRTFSFLLFPFHLLIRRFLSSNAKLSSFSLFPFHLLIRRFLSSNAKLSSFSFSLSLINPTFLKPKCRTFLIMLYFFTGWIMWNKIRIVHLFSQSIQGGRYRNVGRYGRSG